MIKRFYFSHQTSSMKHHLQKHEHNGEIHDIVLGLLMTKEGIPYRYIEPLYIYMYISMGQWRSEGLQRPGANACIGAPPPVW